VRGGGQEQLATGVNPAYNRERFEEAHELIVQDVDAAGAVPLEGTHYQHRVVNPWAVPLQKPHPRVWIPGVLSKETIIWAAQQRYPYIALSTEIEATKKIWELYDKVAAECGYAGGPEIPRVPAALPRRRDRGEGAGQRAPVHVDAGRVHGPGASGVVEPVGLLLTVVPHGLRRVRGGPPLEPRGASFEEQLHNGQILAGTPKTVIPRIRKLLEETRPSIMGFWSADGFVTHADTRSCIRSWARKC
jgi:alkanesulfonate monooxygenase SsuD/methylene tetrahydromethanopterin reductase-like flavin-dependent oxidoreductase (luciferase family)